MAKKRKKCTEIVIAGPSGVGKSELAQYVAGALNWVSVDADFFHSKQAKRNAQNGIPMSDEYRKIWLAKIKGGLMLLSHVGHRGIVIACSALKRWHREYLVKAGKKIGEGETWIVWLDADKEVLQRRVDSREGHWYSKDLLESQLEDAERPTEDEENVIIIDANSDNIVERKDLVLKELPIPLHHFSQG